MCGFETAICKGLFTGSLCLCLLTTWSENHVSEQLHLLPSQASNWKQEGQDGGAAGLGVASGQLTAALVLVGLIVSSVSAGPAPGAKQDAAGGREAKPLPIPFP